MKNETFLRQIAHQKKHWWFQARKQIIFYIIKQIKFQKKINILDFGAGSGVNTEMLAHFGYVDVFEKNKVALKNLKQKLRIKNSYSRFNMKKNYYDLIVLADVIEHIKKPKQALFILKKLLKKNGLILITVPAYQFLYSKKDVSLGHYRRYSKSSLVNEIKNFKIKKVSYF
ncbi:class I SAM-dependent methyltransferase, partial [Candidatus Pelagibacter sp.]|nr:class I SAM-dependent methyltransferase [Candidatus Pelagibacter sp.]